MPNLDPTPAPNWLDDAPWQKYREIFGIREDTTYLNHGSFGPTPRPVRERYQQLRDDLASQPMDFFLRQYDPLLESARRSLGDFIGAEPSNLAFVENATYGMNVVAKSFPLSAGDEVLLPDHAYGSVTRIWQRECDERGASLRTVALPNKERKSNEPLLTEPAEIVEAVISAVGPRTRLLVISHITSVTALTFPLQEICAAMKERGVSVCIDGPHAIAQLPLSLEELHCDYYTASCHKWLSAPLGTGFLYVAPHRQAELKPPILSWGRLPSGKEDSWQDEFDWKGTSDVCGCLSLPTAIEFLQNVGLAAFRERTHALACYARETLSHLSFDAPLTPNSPFTPLSATENDYRWFGCMALVPLPKVKPRIALQQRLWRDAQIEVPIVEFRDDLFVRVSCHLYNQTSEIDRLANTLTEWLKSTA